MKAISSISGRLQSLLARALRRRGGGIVVFAPNAWFPSMIAAPAIIAKVLAERGHVVDVISCAGERKTCTVMDGMAPLEERPARRFCEACVPQSRDYLSRYELTQHFDTDFTNEADRRAVDEMSSCIGEDPRAFVWDGIPIGTLAAGNLSNILKRDIFAHMSEANRDRLRLMVQDGLRWYLIANKICVRFKPKQLVYYAEYYPEIVVGLVASRRGVRVIPITHSNLNAADFRKIQILDRMPQVLDMSRRLPTWPAWRDIPLTPAQIREVSDDVVTRLLGNSALCFSPSLNQNSETANIIGTLDPDLKTIIAYTSSDDEVNNIKMQRGIFGMPVDDSGDLFADQYEWLRTISEFVAESKDHQLIVRLHPRLGSSKRSTGEAEYAEQVAAVTSVKCNRIQIVMPQSEVSSYDLAQYADIILTSWSFMGLECVRLGLPVMMAFRGVDIFPTEGFLNYCTEHESYFSRLQTGAPATLEDLIQAFRYTYMYFAGTALDFSDLVSNYNNPLLPEYSTPNCASVLEDCIVGAGITHEIRLAEQKAAVDSTSHSEERAETGSAIRRIIHVLAFGEDFQPSNLRFDQGMDKLDDRPGDDTLTIRSEGRFVTVICRERNVTRVSKAIESLGRFHQVILEEPAERLQPA